MGGAMDGAVEGASAAKAAGSSGDPSSDPAFGLLAPLKARVILTAKAARMITPTVQFFAGADLVWFGAFIDFVGSIG